MTQFVIGALLGGAGGFYLGRWRAELGAARHAGRRAMATRRDYRTK